ncbi:hypothetical protein [Lichenicoccus sp.]|uniref:hypothetical protein n=1 Tax=Lichenicoccus sp. TaxID=2781899 RepID=UPI003D0987E8
MLLDRLMLRLRPRDGAASSLESLATGIDIDAFEPAPPLPTPTNAGGRRERAAGGEDALIASLSEKVLHAWLQNRHQTLYPLSLNFRTLRQEQQETLAGMLAIALRAGPAARDLTGEPERLRDWLKSVGAGGAALDALERAIAEPPSLSRQLELVIEQDLAAYAYVMGIVASDARYDATLRFLDYLEARLDLPTAVVRSAARRYRR